ncbi:MAG TPA: hypothetical protein GX708_01240 [Gallicola sp.]|nr:hypothetical protein [Gallicola sp.]
MAKEVFINRVIQEYSQATTDPEASANWERPADLVMGVTQDGDSYRLPKPTMNNNEIWYLMGVNENGYNDIAFSCKIDGTTYSVDWWNDGSDIRVYNNNAVAEYNYDFNDSRLANIPVDDKGYKQVWIKITPTDIENNLTGLNCQRKPSWRSNQSYVYHQVLEQYIKASELTSLAHCGDNYIYPILDIFSLEENKISSLNYLLFCCYNLKKIENLDINNINSLDYFMQSCYSYNQPFPDGVTFNNVISAFMQSCSSYNQPFPDGVTFDSVRDSFMANCNSYNQPFPDGVTFNNVTSNFMQNCSSYNQPFPNGVTFNNVTSQFMNYCNSYNQPFPDGVTFNNVTSYFMANCNSYNQPFPDGVTFNNVRSAFMQNCSSYNQPFPDGVTFNNVTNNFMSGCISYNQPLKITFKDNMTATGSDFFGWSPTCYMLEYLRLFNWQTVFKTLDLSYTSINAVALDILAGDAPDRTGLDTGTITIKRTPDALTYDTTLWTDKNYTVVVS